MSAMVTARVADRRIEDLSQRTETTQVFANPDGSWTSKAATGPARVQDEESGGVGRHRHHARGCRWWGSPRRQPSGSSCSPRVVTRPSPRWTSRDASSSGVGQRPFPSRPLTGQPPPMTTVYGDWSVGLSDTPCFSPGPRHLQTYLTETEQQHRQPAQRRLGAVVISDHMCAETYVCSRLPAYIPTAGAASDRAPT